MVIGFTGILFMPLIMHAVASIATAGRIECEQTPFPKNALQITLSASSPQALVVGLHRDIRRFTTEFTQYFENNFMCKSSVFGVYSAIQTTGFNENPLPYDVIEGEDGWLYLGDRYSDVVKESKGISVFDSSEIDEIEMSLLSKNEWLKKHGIDFYLAIAPNKHTIYGEYLPIKKADVLTNRELLLEQFSNSELTVVDLSREFHEHSSERLYHKTNSHWNDLGAYYAYRSLINEISIKHPSVKLVKKDHLTALVDTSYNEDLANLLNEARLEQRYRLLKADSCSILQESILPVPDNYYRRASWYEYRYSCNANELKVLIFRDSYCTAMQPFLVESFGSTLLIWHPEFDKKLILSEKPDIVIYEVVERNLDFLLRY